MEIYTNWLKSCINGITNINLDSVSGYGQALYWQLMFLITGVLTIISIAAILVFIGVGPALYIKRQKKLFSSSVKSVAGKLEGIEKIDIDPDKSFSVGITLNDNYKASIGEKYIIHAVAFIISILVLIAFFTLPFCIQFFSGIFTIFSVIGMLIFLSIVGFTIIDVVQIAGNEEEILYEFFSDNFVEAVPVFAKISSDCICTRISVNDFFIDVFDVSDEFSEIVLHDALNYCDLPLKLSNKSFDSNVEKIKKWVNDEVMPEYEKRLTCL